jgi:hypothetical protein
MRCIIVEIQKDFLTEEDGVLRGLDHSTGAFIKVVGDRGKQYHQSLVDSSEAFVFPGSLLLTR